MTPGLAVRRSLAACAACGSLVAANATATIYRCLEGNRVTYADRPCGDAIVAVLDEQRGVALVSPRSDDPNAASPGVMAGMTLQHVYAAWGRPIQMSMKLERGLLIERWFYRAAQGTTWIEFRFGRVAEVALE